MPDSPHAPSWCAPSAPAPAESGPAPPTRARVSGASWSSAAPRYRPRAPGRWRRAGATDKKSFADSGAAAPAGADRRQRLPLWLARRPARLTGASALSSRAGAGQRCGRRGGPSAADLAAIMPAAIRRGRQTGQLALNTINHLAVRHLGPWVFAGSPAPPREAPARYFRRANSTGRAGHPRRGDPTPVRCPPRTVAAMPPAGLRCGPSVATRTFDTARAAAADYGQVHPGRPASLLVNVSLTVTEFAGGLDGTDRPPGAYCRDQGRSDGGARPVAAPTCCTSIQRSCHGF